MRYTIKTSPVHAHDCTTCKHVATLEMSPEYCGGETPPVHDIYTCHRVENDSIEGTLVIRNSSEEPDYESLPLDIARHVKRGLYVRALQLIAARE
jgi:hypothetical protein